MIHFWNTLNIQITGDTAVTLGKFDGLHRGHQKLLDDIKRKKSRGISNGCFYVCKTSDGIVNWKATTDTFGE